MPGMWERLCIFRVVEVYHKGAKEESEACMQLRMRTGV